MHADEGVDASISALEDLELRTEELRENHLALLSRQHLCARIQRKSIKNDEIDEKIHCMT